MRGGGTLPFANDDEVLDFLRTAPIVGFEKIPMGVTEPRRVILERDGVRLRAAFHDHDIVKDRQRMAGGSVVLYFRDTYVNQVVAYEIARLLGIRNVPPTVLRTIDGTEGSLQLWIENARMEGDRRREKLKFPDVERARRQVADMDVFDALINNLDRTQGNFLWDKESWQLWLIDHTRALGRDRKVSSPEQVKRCSRELMDRLEQLQARSVKRALKRYLTPREVSAAAGSTRASPRVVR